MPMENGHYLGLGWLPSPSVLDLTCMPDPRYLELDTLSSPNALDLVDYQVQAY